MDKLVLATSNPDKLKEIQAILHFPGLTIIPQSEFKVVDADETGLTLIENAIIKARHACQMTGLPALADDTGLAVDYLKGEPGVYSARYAGLPSNSERNIEKLLAALEGVPDDKRGATFYCVMVLMQHANDPMPLIVQGQWSGRILSARAGSQGFGYDAIFYLNEYKMTAAELDPALKNRVSHRAQALEKLSDALLK
ncbi:MAG: RdgB/HAM1 family non-canonical purine NTP pyrophosphatase [Gammaproteobacteria bacterium]|nr:RdgB/HAM1 family non-canonical purine NTP pyrophosphatase [Gammaproteobacteria bacterium]